MEIKKNTIYQQDLPVLVTGEDLPVLVTDVLPEEEKGGDKAFLQWSNLVSQRHVRHVAFDSIRGDLWLATGGGVLHWKLETNRFVRYTSADGLPGNSIFAVVIDATGQVWATHEHFGVYYLKNDIWRFYQILGEVKVSCLTIDSTGRFWVGTSNGIYAIASPERKPTIELPPVGFLPRAIAIMDENDIWLCNPQGVYHYQNSAWFRIGEHPQPDVLTLAREGENLWIGTFRGLLRCNVTTKQISKSKILPSSEVTAITPHPQGVWVACGGQVGLLTETTWTPLEAKRFNSPITSLTTDSHDHLWVGTHEGLLRGENQKIRWYLTGHSPDVIGLTSALHQSPPSFCNLVQSLSVQKLANHSILWIGTPRGLFHYNLSTKNWRRYGQFAGKDIRAIVTSQNQENVWVASWSSGLHSLKPKAELETISNISKPISALSTGQDSQLWSVGLDGVYHYHNSVWVQVILAQEIPVKGLLQSVSQAVAENLWLGTSKGLLIYKPNTKELNIVNGHLGSADIRSLIVIFQNDSELIFVGTSQGLYVSKSDNWESVTYLENRTITALLWDANFSSLWVGTDKGLFRLLIQEQNFKIVNNFDIHNSGLGANRVTALNISIEETRETKLWIGTTSGLSCYQY